MNETYRSDSAQQFKWVGTRPVRPDGVPKVTGRALYGADFVMPGMLTGRILRSPHAHARIRSIDTSKAAALPGVKAIVTSADLPEQKFEYVGPERVAQNFWHMTRNIMAREKALYEGHAIAAVAATSGSIAEQALALIKVDYEVLPHVIDVDAAMAPDAPLLFDDMITRGIDPPPKKASNVTKRTEYKMGDPDAAFKTADEVVEMSFKTAPVHQGYIEPQACVARYDADGQSELWSSSQGHFVVRYYTTQLLGMQMGDLRVYPAEIGGAFGGKTVVYVEPVAVALSKKAGAPVRVVMSRDEVFKGSGPTSGSSMWVKIGVSRDGTIVAGDCELKYQAGAFPGSPVMNGCMCAFAPYDLKNARAVGYDVVSNRPKVAAYRAPGSPIVAFAVESVLDALAQKIGMDPLELRLKNAARKGTKMLSGATLNHDGYADTLEALIRHPDYKAPLGKNQGRGVASGYWFNGGGESSATVHVNEDGTVVVATGSPDIGGSRASMALMAAETLGVDYEKVRPIVADTASVGYTHVTGGSRVTFATGMAVVEATKKIVADLCNRAAQLWKVDPEGVVWENGYAKPASSNVGDGSRARLCHPLLRRRGRSRDRQGDDSALRGGAGRGARHPPELRRRADPGRRGAGYRLGAQRGIHLRREGPHGERGLPRLPDSGVVRPADDRAGPGRGAQPRPPLRRQGRRRGQHLPAHGGDRQRDRARHRQAVDRTAHVAPEGARGAGWGVISNQ
jgi:CO/xanthine dehydrogenase Mo-binding subunit